MADAQFLLRRFSRLEEGRKTWDSHWSEIARVMWPAADEFITKREPGEKRSLEVYDPTASLALEKFAAAMESMLTPRAQKWHRLRASEDQLNKDSEVRSWFDELNRILFAIRGSPKAAYYANKHEGYKSLGAFGNECMFVDEQPAGGIRYKNCHIGQVYIELDHHGRVDTIFRKYPLSAKAAYQRWGKQLGAGKVAQSLTDNPWKSFDFLHIVLPRIEGYDPERADIVGMPWESFDLSIADKAIIEEGGYHELPYMYSRYTLNPTEKHGRSPAMLVLPAIKTLQEMEKTHLRAGHKVADPPLLLFSDGVLGSGGKAVTLRPGGLNYGGLDEQGRELIKALHTGARVDITHEMMAEKREVINDAFLVTLFQILVDQPQMTATEALLRAQEKGQLLAPTIGRQQSEMLGPQIEREIAILVRQGAIPPMPQALIEAEGEYEIEYESPATRMQRAEELIGIQRTLEIGSPFIQVDPSALEIFKADEVFRLAADINGVPRKVMHSEEEMDAIREAQAEAGEEADMVDQAPAAAKALRDVAAAQSDMARVPPLSGSEGVPPA